MPPEDALSFRQNPTAFGDLLESERAALMLSFEEFKKSLAESANVLTDKQIDVLRVAFDKWADAAFDDFVAEMNADKAMQL